MMRKFLALSATIFVFGGMTQYVHAASCKVHFRKSFNGSSVAIPLSAPDKYNNQSSGTSPDGRYQITANIMGAVVQLEIRDNLNNSDAFVSASLDTPISLVLSNTASGANRQAIGTDAVVDCQK